MEFLLTLGKTKDMSSNIAITTTKNSRLEGIDFSNLAFGRSFSDHMFVVDYAEKQWVNPRIVPFESFMIHPSAMALHYGQAIFEGMKASKNKDGKACLFRPELHARRINASARRMSMPEFPEELFLEGLQQLVALDSGWIPPQEGSALYIRPFMFATDGSFGVRPSDRYTFMIFTGPVGPYYAEPVKLKAETHFVRAVPGGTGEAKAAGNYAGALLPTELAKQEGFDQVMWLDGHEFRYVQEVGTMNIFFVIDGKVVTPATDGAILKGITRATILEILREKGIPVEERKLDIHELIAAHEQGTLQEAWGAGTAAVIAPIASITYQGQLIPLPSADKFAIGNAMKDTINGLRSGRVADTHNWVVVVN